MGLFYVLIVVIRENLSWVDLIIPIYGRQNRNNEFLTYFVVFGNVNLKGFWECGINEIWSFMILAAAMKARNIGTL